MEKLYPEIQPMVLGEYYVRHMSAMTTENLESKSDIAVQLAWRDKRLCEALVEIAKLRSRIDSLIQVAAGDYLAYVHEGEQIDAMDE